MSNVLCGGCCANSLTRADTGITVLNSSRSYVVRHRPHSLNISSETTGPIKVKLNDHLFGKGLFIRITASAFRKLLSVYEVSYFTFGFEGRMWDLIESVPDHCLSFYFSYWASMGWGNESLFKSSGHMTKMAAMPIYGKILTKSSSPEPKSRWLFTLWPWVDHDLFYGKVKFCPLCFCSRKG